MNTTYSNLGGTTKVNIDFDDVEQVYSGRDGCRCGCKGKYYTPDESPAMVRKVIKAINNSTDADVLVERDGLIIDFEVSTNRVYTAYIKFQ